jgi:UDP-N-acetylmuramate--alanine ligase
MKPHLHFMGIGGVSMSGLALCYKAKGYPVSGCDISTPATLELLRQAGVTLYQGHDPAHLVGVNTLISTMAVPDDHPELRAARQLGIRCQKRIELLAELFDEHTAIGITGTHGKSTTTGMIATIFLATGQDPSVQIGATLPAIGGNVAIGQSRYLIAEVDESDPGFSRLKASIAVVTNLEDDHIAGDYGERRNYHASLADLEQATRRYLSQADQVVYCHDWPSLHSLAKDLPSAVSYGFSQEADYQIADLRLEPHSSTFTLRPPTGERITVTLNIPGQYNVHNAAAALCAAALAGIDLAQAAAALANYHGVGRRWQRWGEIGGALIIDDYAHHPTEIAATLTAARRTGRRVRAVLQPHRWIRTARHWPALADAVSLADEILVLDVYSAGEQAIAGVSAQLIVDRLVAAGKYASHHTHDSARRYLTTTLAHNDLIITLGAGDVWQIAAGLAQEAAHVRH